MKYHIRLLTALALLLLVLPATVCARSVLTSEPPTNSDGFSISDITGLWRIVRITRMPGVPTPIVEHGTVDVLSDGSTTIWVETPGGSSSTTYCTMQVLSDGQVLKDYNPWGILSFDRSMILASGSDPGVWLALCTRPDANASTADAAGSWRMHTLLVTPTSDQWKMLTGNIDNTGLLSGTQIDSSANTGPYEVPVSVAPDGGLTFADPLSLTDAGQVAPNGLTFGHVGASSPPGTARFDVGVRTGGNFINADLAGKWYLYGVNTAGHQFSGHIDCASTGSYTGEIHNNSGNTDQIAGTMGTSADGMLNIIDPTIGPMGPGTLSLDRSFLVFTWSEDNGRTLMVGTKHPTDISASVDVTEVSMNWGNGFSFNEPLDQTWDQPLCNLPAVAVHGANFRKPVPPTGAMAAAGLVYGRDDDLQSPIFTPGKIALPATLTGGGSDISSRFMPELSLYEWPWPARTGDIELRAVIDAFHGDPATQLGNGVLSSEVGFSVMGPVGSWGDVWLSFGFATLNLTEPIGEMAPGYYNRQPFINFGVYNADTEDFSVAPANGYDPAYPVELKIVITPNKLARFLAHFGPSQNEWTLCGEAQLDWWPGPEVGVAGCGTNAGPDLTWYSPYVSSGFEYVDVSGPEEPTPLEITTTTLNDGSTDRFYSQFLEATGGTGGQLTWELVSGELPPGLSLAPSGEITGHPWEDGIYRFTVAVRDGATGYDEQELILSVYEDVLNRLWGRWGVHQITAGSPTHPGHVSYGDLYIDYWGSATLNLFGLDGTTSTSGFSLVASPDGTLYADGVQWGVLSFDGSRIIAAGCTSDEGSLMICTRLDQSSVFSSADCEGPWAMHSFTLNSPAEGWKTVLGSIDSEGVFTGTGTTCDGISGPYTAQVSIDGHGEMQIAEPGSTMPQHAGMTAGRTLFGRITGGSSDPASFDIGIRTGSPYTSDDIKGLWRIKSMSSDGSISHVWIDVDETGHFTGQSSDCSGVPEEQISGIISVDESGALSIAPDGPGLLPGRGTLSLNRDFFMFTFSEPNWYTVLLGDRRSPETHSSVDVTKVTLDWGNGFGFDDPLDLDTLGSACDGSAVLVDGSYLTSPVLPPDGQVQAFYTSVGDSQVSDPTFETGKFAFSTTTLPGFDESECATVIGASTNSITWYAQSGNVEIRAVFENLQTDASAVGTTVTDCIVGFQVSQGDNDIGNIQAVFGLLNGYFHRGIQGIPSGYHSDTPYAGIFSEQEDSTEDMSLMTPIGFDPTQPLEVKLVVTPYGLATSFVRFGAGDWVQTGEVQSGFWPANAYGIGCHVPDVGEDRITYMPYILHRTENVEIDSPQIEPYSLSQAINGSPYEVQFRSEGGIPPHQWSISSGSLPEGLEMGQDGLLSGTPSEAGTFEFTVRVEDGQIPSAVAEAHYELTVLQPASIQDAKALPDGSQVAIVDAVVTRRVDDGYYVESQDRSAGIKVSYWGFLAEGWTVKVIGNTGTDGNFERVIYGTCEATDTGHTYLRPIGMPTRSLGGTGLSYDRTAATGQMGVANPYGPNNIGLFIKTWGKVTQIDTYGNYFYIDDGSGLKDGTYTGMDENIGVRIDHSPMDLEAGDQVTVTGISSCTSFDYLRTQRVIRACDFGVHYPARPAFVLGTPDRAPGSCQIIFSEVLGAAGYRLYESTDGMTYTPSDAVPMMQEGYGIFPLVPGMNTHYKVAALDAEGNEGRFSRDVHAKVADPQETFQIFQPERDSQYVPLDPSVYTSGIHDAMRMGIEIHEASTDQTVWGIVTYAYGSNASYGQRGKYVTYAPAGSLLQPRTDYWAYCYAVDAENWSFANTGEWPFRTGDDYGHYGGGPRSGGTDGPSSIPE